jgi:hypothetical protein
MFARPVALVRGLAAALLCLPLVCQAQTPELKIPSFDHLRHQATDSVDITLGAWPLRVAAFFMDKDDPEEAELKELFRSLSSIHVRKYEFDTDFAYSQDDVESVRRQLQSGGWTPLVQVRNRDDRESVDVCILIDGDKTRGLAIVASEPREFAIVHMVGSIDMEALARLDGHGHLGLPKLDTVAAQADPPILDDSSPTE